MNMVGQRNMHVTSYDDVSPTIDTRGKAILSKSPNSKRRFGDFGDMLDMFDMGRKFGKKKKS
jgi:hypothetical protein